MTTRHRRSVPWICLVPINAFDRLRWHSPSSPESVLQSLQRKNSRAVGLTEYLGEVGKIEVRPSDDIMEDIEVTNDEARFP